MIYKLGIALCIAFTLYGQIAAKIAARQLGPFPSASNARLAYVGHMLINPFFISCFVAATLAALCWMVALSGMELSRAYPFMSLNFVLVLTAGAVIFREPLTPGRIVGVALIVSGVVIASLFG
jgi:drug/metabolite transporter (DMT)-like permease